MSDDHDTKLVIGYKRNVAKVAKKDSDINGLPYLQPFCSRLTSRWQP
jgi:hypothetical protein